MSLRKLMEYIDAGSEISLAIDGVQYPVLPFFLTPPPPYMSAHFDDRTFTADFNITAEGGKIHHFHFEGNYSALVVEIYYNLIDHEKYIFEFGKLFKVIGDKAIEIKEAAPSKTNATTFVLLKGDPKNVIASQASMLMKIKPKSIGSGNAVVNGTIKFQCSDEHMAEMWNESLGKMGFHSKRDGKYVTVKIGESQTAYNLRFLHYVDEMVEAKYKAKDFAEEPTYSDYITATSEIKLQGVMYTRIDVRVLDQYANPLPGALVKLISEPDCVEAVGLKNKTAVTGSDGVATFIIDVTGCPAGEPVNIWFNVTSGG